jgi:hypothetical protein
MLVLCLCHVGQITHRVPQGGGGVKWGLVGGCSGLRLGAVPGRCETRPGYIEPKTHC